MTVYFERTLDRAKKKVEAPIPWDTERVGQRQERSASNSLEGRKKTMYWLPLNATLSLCHSLRCALGRLCVDESI